MSECSPHGNVGDGLYSPDFSSRVVLIAPNTSGSRFRISSI